jgi:hypothetical protein
MTVQGSYMSKLYRLFPTAFTITMLFFDGVAFAQSTGSIGDTMIRIRIRSPSSPRCSWRYPHARRRS